MTTFEVTILDKDRAVGDWLLKHLEQINVPAHWLPTATDLLTKSEHQPPTVCLVALRPPIAQALTLITDLRQEPRFSKTAFILMGPSHYKHAAFEAGADDYLATPPDVIELRKRVRLYLDRAELEVRIVTETRITQEIEALNEVLNAEQADTELMESEALTLLEHAAQLTEERNLFETILNFASPAIALVTPSGELLYANPAWEVLIGSRTQAVVGDVIEWPPQTSNPTDNQAIVNAINRQLPWQSEVNCTLPNDEQLVLAISLQPAFDASNEIVGFVMIQEDVTERHAREKEKTRFLSDAVYQMRSPVSNIKMRQYLLNRAPADQRTMHLDALKRETDRLASMVEAMMELARLNTGQISLKCEQTDLNRLLSDSITRYTPTAEAKGLTLALRRNDDLPAAMIDPALFARAVGILIENAMIYTPDSGHIEILLDTETWTGSNFITVKVSDTGMGISLDALPYIFDQFYRSDRARDAGTQGVGLGLAIAQEIIVRHNGHISAESEVDGGSTFTIWLPINEDCA